MDQRRVDSWTRIDNLGALACAAASLALSAAAMLRRPDLVEGGDFLFHDVGHNLLAAHIILTGGTLYRDLFFPYGPLGAYVYAAAARLLGNTPATYVGLFAAVSAVNTALVFALARRAARFGVALFVAAAAIAVVTIPGALAGAFLSSPFIVFERTLLLAIALLWQPPGRRTWGRAVSIGVALGLWQGFKFGGAFFAGAALLTLDGVSLAAAQQSSDRVRSWIQSLMWTLAAFAVVQGVWILLAVVTLPSPIARDVVWPFYMFRAYDVIDGDVRWPGWGGWRLMVGQYLLPLAAAAMGLAGFAAWIIRARRDAASEAAGGAFVLIAFYVLASFGYFHHVFHFQQFLWVFVPASAYWLQRQRRTIVAAAAMLFVPGVLVAVRAMAWTSMSPGVESLTLPTGGRLVIPAALVERVRFLDRIRSEVGEAPEVYVGVGSGWQYAYGVPTATRHTFFFAPDVVRPYERGEFDKSFRRVGAIVDCGDPAAEWVMHAANRQSRWIEAARDSGCAVRRPERLSQ